LKNNCNGIEKNNRAEAPVPDLMTTYKKAIQVFKTWMAFIVKYLLLYKPNGS